MCIGIASAFSACSTDEDFFYQDEPRVRLVGDYTWAVGTDSISFSFVAYPTTTTEQTFNVDAQIMGNPVDRDRTANISIDPQKTTADASLYTLPQTVTVPAGQTKGTFQVSVRRDASLQQKSARLYIKVDDSADFKKGVNEQDHLVIVWNDILSKPKNWADLEEFFGTYSNTKYRFMLDNMVGMGELSIETMSWSMLNSLRIQFQNALNDYNAAHPGNPLTDENGQAVTFE